MRRYLEDVWAKGLIFDDINGTLETAVQKCNQSVTVMEFRITLVCLQNLSILFQTISELMVKYTSWCARGRTRAHVRDHVRTRTYVHMPADVVEF